MSNQQACVDSVYKEMLSEVFKETDLYIDCLLNTKKKTREKFKHFKPY